MKTIKNLVLVAIVSIGFSCSSSENDSPVDSKLIVGDWQMDSYEYSVSTSMTFLDEVFETSNTGVSVENDAYLSFSESPNVYTGGGSYVILLKTELNGVSSEEEIEMENLFQNGTWEVNGDKLLIANSGQDLQELTITKLNSTSLEIHFLEESTVDYQGSTVISKTEGTAIFTRN